MDLSSDLHEDAEVFPIIRTKTAEWETAAVKLEELDALVANAARMRRAIEVGLQCGCIRLEDCALPETNRALAAAKRRRQAIRNT